VEPLGSGSVPVDTPITATFSEQVTIQPDSLSLKNIENVSFPRTTTLETDDITLIFNKTSYLQYNFTYIATITGVKNKAWTFTTASSGSPLRICLKPMISSTFNKLLQFVHFCTTEYAATSFVVYR
jgi:hypothetical protein